MDVLKTHKKNIKILEDNLQSQKIDSDLEKQRTTREIKFLNETICELNTNIKELSTEISTLRSNEAIELFRAANTGEEIIGALNKIIEQITTSFPYNELIAIAKNKCEENHFEWSLDHKLLLRDILNIRDMYKK